MKYVILFGDELLKALAIGPLDASQIEAVISYLDDENITVIPLRPVEEVVK